MQGEDGGHFTLRETAKSKAVCEEKVMERYPESFIIEINPYGTHQERSYNNALQGYYD